MSFLLAAVLYLDRASLSVLAPAVRRDLGIGPMAMGLVFSAFVWGYALFHIPAGWLCDRFGARRVLAAIVVLWSFFTAATGTAWNLSSLLVLRFLFGAAEAGAMPGVSRAFARWIPPEERARAQGICFAGMSAGGALAPALATFLMLQWGWRSTFAVLGCIGLIWAAAWYLWFRDEPANTRLTPALAAAPPVEWRKVLRSSNLWAILFMYFTYGYTGYIYITWFPSYLMEARNLPAAAAGILAAAPSVLGMIAKPLGGWWSDRLCASRGVVFGRRTVGIFGFALAAAVVAPGLYASNPYLAVLLLALADGGAALTHGVCFAVCLDVGMNRAGTVSALMLTMGSLGNVASSLIFGAFLQAGGGWTAPFLVGMAANLAGALLWLKINPKKQLL